VRSPSSLFNRDACGGKLRTSTQMMSDRFAGYTSLTPPNILLGSSLLEIWFSILVRKLLKRASFKSQDDLKTRILEFIDYFNKTMAKPFKWTYKGKVLAI
jgi:hypothetical protein